MKNRELVLEKTHDYSKSKNPRLAVIFIHGIASDSSTFNNALRYLEEVDCLEDVRFITFDLLGSGKSLKDDELNYDYEDQIEALHNAIKRLKLNTPLILVGHSLGTFIVTRYADTYKGFVRKLILLSPPVYTESDLENPLFKDGIRAFEDVVSLKNHDILKEKAFKNSMEKIVLDKSNYKVLSELKTPAILIYGDEDQFIGIQNIPEILRINQKYLTGIKTKGRHSVSRDKYIKLVEILKEDLDA